MSSLVQVLFPSPTLRRDPVAVIGWWERRRLAYNALVGGAGLITLSAVALANVFVWSKPAMPPLGAIAVYALAANLFYSLGAVSELAVQRWTRRPAYGVGPALFRHGLVFAVGLTLLPIAMVVFGATFTIASRIFGWG